MIFYVFGFIVFLAELIIALAIVLTLYKWDKIILEFDEIVDNLKPDIKEIMLLIKKISEQVYELAPEWKKNIIKFFVNILLNQFQSLIAGVTFKLIKNSFEKRINKNKESFVKQ